MDTARNNRGKVFFPKVTREDVSKLTILSLMLFVMEFVPVLWSKKK